jgi:hypothetical protein
LAGTGITLYTAVNTLYGLNTSISIDSSAVEIHILDFPSPNTTHLLNVSLYKIGSLAAKSKHLLTVSLNSYNNNHSLFDFDYAVVTEGDSR